MRNKKLQKKRIANKKKEDYLYWKEGMERTEKYIEDEKAYIEWCDPRSPEELESVRESFRSSHYSNILIK